MKAYSDWSLTDVAQCTKPLLSTSVVPSHCFSTASMTGHAIGSGQFLPPAGESLCMVSHGSFAYKNCAHQFILVHAPCRAVVHALQPRYQKSYPCLTKSIHNYQECATLSKTIHVLHRAGTQQESDFARHCSGMTPHIQLGLLSEAVHVWCMRVLS